MAQSTFLVTEIRAVVHSRWRDCQPGDLTCQHKRPNRLRTTTNEPFMRKQHKSPKKLDGRPILNSYEQNFLRFYIHISELLVFLREAQPVCRSYGAQVLNSVVGGCPRPGTTGRQYTAYRQTYRKSGTGKGSSSFTP